MRRSFSLIGAAICGFWISGCSGSSVAPAAGLPAGSGTVGVTEESPGQVKLGHFLSSDGMYGFVLDRTGAKPKIRMDGQNDIIALNVREDRSAGELRGYYFDHPNGQAVVYLTKSGELRYLHGNDELKVSRDKAAEALGTPDVAGEPKLIGVSLRRTVGASPMTDEAARRRETSC